jgi:glycine cleavage system aminomethyltransferase T
MAGTARGRAHGRFAGYWMPVQYEGIIAEHLWTRAHAGFFDVSHMGQLVSRAKAEAAIEAAADRPVHPAAGRGALFAAARCQWRHSG